MENKNKQKQVNIRLDDRTLSQIDKCRSQMMGESGIPTRSDVVRLAIDDFLKRYFKK